MSQQMPIGEGKNSDWCYLDVPEGRSIIPETEGLLCLFLLIKKKRR
jgi:hypothetical protein